MEYKDNMGAMEPQRVHTVVISVQHSPDITLDEIRRSLMEKVVKVVIPAKYLDEKTVYHLLPSGKFLMGGPQVRTHHRGGKGVSTYCRTSLMFVLSTGRCRTHGPENHCGHLWRMGRPRRGGFLWERLLQSGSIRSICSSLGRQVSGQSRTVQESPGSGEEHLLKEP